MRVTILTALALGLVPAVLADTVEIWYWTPFGTSMMFSTLESRYNVPYNPRGCTANPGVPGLELLCMDVDNNWGYFLFTGQDYRCVSFNSYNNYGPDGIPNESWLYTEAPCSFGRMAATANADGKSGIDAIGAAGVIPIIPDTGLDHVCPVPPQFPDKVAPLDLLLPLETKGQALETC